MKTWMFDHQGTSESGALLNGNDDPANGFGTSADGFAPDFSGTTYVLPSQSAAPSETSAPGSVADSPPSPSLQDEVTYLSGVNSLGAVAATSFWTWNRNTNPATYATSSYASKWGNGTPGTSGGTEYYYFNPASNWTATEENTFIACLELWSAVANINFVETTNAATANLTITRGTDKQADETSGGQYLESIGATKLNQPLGPAVISIDTSVASFGPIGTFGTTLGEYAIETVIHEEGHFLGLGHAGPYNGSVISSTQQYSQYDTRLWTVMSYINPNDTSAEYYSSYSVAGTNWASGDGINNYPTTIMPLDILAAQRLYGLPTSTPLSGGQVFGFDCNITGALQRFFDFTINTDPVITIWDAGGGNTLNLSGYSTACTINLNPGTFSSFDGMTNNLAIAFNTAIDTVVGSAGNDIFIVNSDSDTITGGTGTNTVEFGGNYAAYTVVRAANGTVTVSENGITDTLNNIEYLHFADQTVNTGDLGCFVAGTRLATLRGEVAVEALREGDMLVLARGGTAPVVWLGHRVLDCTRHARPHDVMPVRMRAHAFGPGRPHSDLLLSPDHAVFADGVLIPVRYLINGATIIQQQVRHVEYWHVELPTHDVVLAQGLPAESYLDTGNRDSFGNGGGAVALHPDFARNIWAEAACAPLVLSGAEREAVRSMLLVQAESLGWHIIRDPAVSLEIAGARMAPEHFGDRLCFALPGEIAEARLVSRCYVPSETEAESDDCRRLGVAVSALWLDGDAVPLDSPRLGAGWNAPETAWRWTDGAGAITLAGARTLEIRLCITGRYWRGGRRATAA